jgi:hypothetical protein
MISIGYLYQCHTYHIEGKRTLKRISILRVELQVVYLGVMMYWNLGGKVSQKYFGMNGEILYARPLLIC